MRVWRPLKFIILRPMHFANNSRNKSLKGFKISLCKKKDRKLVDSNLQWRVVSFTGKHIMQYCCSYNNSNKKSKFNLSLNSNKYHRNPHFKTSNVRSIRLLMALMPICVFYKYYNTVQIVLVCTTQIVVVLWNYYFV